MRVVDSLVRAAEERCQRLDSIERELANWQARHNSAGNQIKQLSERETAESEEITRLAAIPEEIEQRRDILMKNIQQLTTTRTEAANKLAEAENQLAAADKTLRNAETTLAKAREEHEYRAISVRSAQMGAHMRELIVLPILI